MSFPGERRCGRGSRGDGTSMRSEARCSVAGIEERHLAVSLPKQLEISMSAFKDCCLTGMLSLLVHGSC